MKRAISWILTIIHALIWTNVKAFMIARIFASILKEPTSVTVPMDLNLVLISSIVMIKMNASILHAQMDTARIQLDRLYASVRMVMSWIRMVSHVSIETNAKTILMIAVTIALILPEGKKLFLIKFSYLSDFLLTLPSQL